MIKVISVITLLALLSGCASLTPRERHLAEFGAALLITGAIAASQHDSHDSMAARPTNLPVVCGPTGAACQ